MRRSSEPARPRRYAVPLLLGGLAAALAIALAVALLPRGGGSADARRGAAGRAPLRRCPPAGTHLIARDAALRVYSWPKPAAGAGAIEACVLRTGARMTLLAARTRSGPQRLPGSLERVVLARRVVAYVVDRLTGVDTSASELIVADVARRRVLRKAEVGRSIDAGFVAAERLTALVATPRGAVAWISAGHGPGGKGTSTVEVHAAPPVGHTVILDQGPAIDPAALRLSGSTLSWMNGSSRRTAAMP